MYNTEAGYDWLMLSEALSFETAAMPLSSGLMVVIKVMINEVNSVPCTVGVLHSAFVKFFQVASGPWKVVLTVPHHMLVDPIR